MFCRIVVLCKFSAPLVCAHAVCLHWQDDGITSLWLASQEGHESAVRTLLSFGAAVNQARTVSCYCVRAFTMCMNVSDRVCSLKRSIELGADAELSSSGVGS